jgi:hypothetical protein
MENKQITKEDFIISRLATKISQLETFVAELEFQNALLMERINTLEKEDKTDGKEE